MDKLNGAQWIAKILKEYEVTHVFYVLAILRKGLGYIEDEEIVRVTAHTEKAAAYMADGYARISKKPGVAMAQSVGAANLAAGLQDAYLGHIPLIAITGRKPFLYQYRNAYQEINHVPMFDAVTKYNVNVDTGEQLPLLMHQAFREAVSGAPRPVHLDLLGYAGEFIEDKIINEKPIANKNYVKAPAKRITPTINEIKDVVDMIKIAERPVMVYGSGAAISDAGKEIFNLSKTLSIPVAFSCHGKGLVPDTYELNCGAVGSYSCESANRVVSQADLVIFIGSGTGDQVTLDWTIPADNVKKIQIDINPHELGRSYANVYGILGDAKISLQLINENLKGINPKVEWGDLCQKIIKERKDALEEVRNSNAIPIRPERLCKSIGDSLPENAIVVADTGYSAIWASTMIELNNPQQTFIRASGSLGWAFPASLGAKCAAPDRPVICFTGDGGFMYHIAELETAKRKNINTITIVNNNSSFGQSRLGIDGAYKNKKQGKGINKEELYDFGQVNYAKVAEAMGCIGVRVEDPEHIEPTIKKHLNSKLPVVIEVISDANAHPPVTWKP